jgi:phage N-6-adenine-methyltransferase
MDLPTASSDTWNTPASLLELVRHVMGGIDVDPASNLEAQTLVQAGTFYTLETDGLAHEWPGRAFVNPPYSDVAPFVAKLLTEFDAGRATEAIVLVNARSSSAWFQRLAARAWRCELRQRVKFWRPERPAGSAGRQASVVFYAGPNVRRFTAAFRPLGAVTRPAAGIRDTRACVMCGEPVEARREDAVTCSARCRKRLERSRKRATESRTAA